MKYAYEDDDKENITEEEEKIDENLNVKEKKNIKEEEKVEVPKTKDEVLIDNLLVEENDTTEDNTLTYDELITKKDEVLFELYLGKRYEHITTKSFNFSGLIFGPIYLFYRKVYLIAFIWMLINLFCICILPLANVSYVIIGIFLICSYACAGMFSNQIILNQAAGKIINLKIAGSKKIKDDVKKAGGTNLLVAIVMSLITSFLTSYSCFYAFPNLYQNLYDLNSQDEVIFDGNIDVDESVNIKDTLKITVPNNFYDASSSDSHYYFVYEDVDAYIPLCTIELVPVESYQSPESLINAIANYHLELTDNIKSSSSNGIDWEYINVTSSDKDIYYATSKVENNMYLLKYAYNYQMEEECGKYFYEVLESIK